MIDDFDDTDSYPNPASKSVQLIAPKQTSYFPQGKIEGYLVLHFFGQPVTFIGGAFDSFKPGALGICLEKHSSQAKLATHPFPIEDFQAPSAKQTEGLLVQVVNAALDEPGTPVFVGCRAGRGRTGTILSAFAKISDEAPADPVAYVRDKYLKYAVETSAQAKLVRDLNEQRVRAILSNREEPGRDPIAESAEKPTAEPTLLERWFRFFNWG